MWWKFEQRLWQLLPMALLPCTSSLLLPGTPHPTQPHGELLLQQLLVLSQKAAPLSLQLRQPGVLHTLGLPSELPPAVAAAAYDEELLGVLLQLAERLLHQQPPTPAVTAVTPAPATTGGSSSQSESLLGSVSLKAVCAGPLLSLLLHAALASARGSRGPRPWQRSQQQQPQPLW